MSEEKKGVEIVSKKGIHSKGRKGNCKKRRELKERREQNLLPAYSLVISLCYSLRKNISISCRMFRKRYRIGHDDDRVMEVKK